MNWAFCENCECRTCEDQDNCAMCGCEGGGCEPDNPMPHYECDEYRPQLEDDSEEKFSDE